MTINEMSDKQLADMVRNSIYAKNTRFGAGSQDARFLLVLAVPYGKDENIETLAQAIYSFAQLLQDGDWPERRFQVYDYEASQHFFEASYEDVEESA